MRVLVDTHILLWALVETGKLSEDARTILENDENECFFSPVSIMEIAIKTGLGKAEFTADPRRVLRLALAAGFLERPLSSIAAARLVELPLYHRDPFDRLLIAQALDFEARLLTADRALSAYGSHVVLVD